MSLTRQPPARFAPANFGPLGVRAFISRAGEQDAAVDVAGHGRLRLEGQLIGEGEGAVPIAAETRSPIRPMPNWTANWRSPPAAGEARSPPRRHDGPFFAVVVHREDCEVVVGAERLVLEVVLERDRERLSEQRARLVGPSVKEQRLRVQRLGEYGGEAVVLGDSERELDPLHRRFVVALEVANAPRPEPPARRRSHPALPRLARRGQARAPRVPPRHVRLPERHAELGGRARGVVRRPAASNRDSGVRSVDLAAAGSFAAAPCSPARSSSRARSAGSSATRCGAVEGALRLLGRGERRPRVRPRAEPVARLALIVVGVVRFGSAASASTVMRGDHLGDLIRVEPRVALQVRRGREMPSLALPSRQRVVGDALDERLEEAVLAALRRARVGLDVSISLRTSAASIGSTSAS